MNFCSSLSLYGVYICLKLLVRSDVCFCDIVQVSWACVLFCAGMKFTVDVTDCSIFLLSMEISCLAYFFKSRIADHVSNHAGTKRVPANRDSL